MHVFLQWPLVAFDVSALLYLTPLKSCPTIFDIESFYEKVKNDG